MSAQVVQQNVALLGERIWKEWRAVCDAHPQDEPFIPSWQGTHTHESWIDAFWDALRHNREHHLDELPSWEELMEEARLRAEQIPEDGYTPKRLQRPPRSPIGRGIRLKIGSVRVRVPARGRDS